jgi:hypothetical protein
MYNVTLRHIRESLLLWKSNKYYTFLCVHTCVRVPKRVCVCMHVALLIQHATCMHHILTSFVAPLAPPYFLTLSQK